VSVVPYENPDTGCNISSCITLQLLTSLDQKCWCKLFQNPFIFLAV